MLRSHVRGTTLVAAGVLLSVLRAVSAGEPPAEKPYFEIKAEYDAAAAAKDRKQQEVILPTLATAAAREKVETQVDEVVSICKKQMTYGRESLQIAALRAMGILAKPGTSQLLRPFLIGDKALKRSQSVRLAAIEAWARIHDPGTHELLLDHVRVPHHEKERKELATQCVTMYRHYKEVAKKHRFVVMRDFMQAFFHISDSANGWVWPSASAQDWWGLLHAPMVETFAELAHDPATKFTTFEDCNRWWKEHRGRIQAGKE